jgi:hypothetical protein
MAERVKSKHDESAPEPDEEEEEKEEKEPEQPPRKRRKKQPKPKSKPSEPEAALHKLETQADSPAPAAGRRSARLAQAVRAGPALLDVLWAESEEEEDAVMDDFMECDV